MRGVAIEALADKRGQTVRPVALAIQCRPPLTSKHGLKAEQILSELLAGSETGGDLVTIRVDYLAAMIGLATDQQTAAALWSGQRTHIGDYTVDLIPAMCLWIKRGDRTIRVNDIQRWMPPDSTEAAMIYTPDRNPTEAYERWEWTEADYDKAIEAAGQGAQWAGDVAESIDGALGRAGLPRHWRDGTGRVAGATLDRITGKNLAIVSDTPMVLARAINTAYVGGRITIHQTGRYESITQVDMNSAYPYAMTMLPTLEGATWHRRRWYDPEEEYGLWRVTWDVPKGAVSGPFPVRTKNNQIIYPLVGEGWYWGVEVHAAIEIYGSMIEPIDGFAVRPMTQEKPFATLGDYYQQRKQMKREGDAAAAHVAKLGLTATYGRLAQAVQHNGKPGRWGSLTLAGLTTATVRAHMSRVLWEYETKAVAIATDSLTVDGQLDLIASDKLGGWSIKTGGNALMLPSGVFRVETGDAAMDRVSGVERARSLLIDWDAIYDGWDALGLALSYRVAMPMFIGLGIAGSSNQWPRFGSWKLGNHEIVGMPHHAKPVRIQNRVWRLMPQPGASIKAMAYKSRAGVIGRTIDQSNTTVPETAREHDQPFL